MTGRRVDVRLVTAAHLPDLAPDDRALRQALEEEGVSVEVSVWDDADVDWSSAPVTVIRSVFDYHLRCGEFLDWLDQAAKLTLVQNSAALVQWNAHKVYLRLLGEAGFPTIPTEWVSQSSGCCGADLGEILESRGWVDAVVKPCISASARGAVHVRADDVVAGQRHLETLLETGDAMVQPLLPDFDSSGEHSLIWLGKRQTHAVLRPSGLASTLEEAHVGGSYTASHEELSLARRVYEWLPERPLYARIDLIDSQDFGLLVLEVELIEPALYLRHSPLFARAFADAVVELLPTRAL